jgi:single-strand DNA-binding protein
MSHSVPPVNTLILVGHLTSDPVLRTLSHDRKVCDMRIAVHDKRDPSPMFLDIATFGAQAEACAQYLTKGRAIAFTGRLVYREWETEDGTRRSKHQAVGRVQFGPQPRGEHESSQDTDEAAL